MTRGALLGTAVVALLGSACRAPTPPPAQDCSGPLPRPAGLLLAGSGACLAPARWLVAHVLSPDLRGQARVAESIGTGGAVRALLDDAIDVGLASRPLKDRERAAGLVEHPLARVPLAVVVHEARGLTAMSRQRLIALYNGEVHAWPDGQAVVPLLRQAGDSTTRVIATAIPELGEVMATAAREGRGRVCYTDQEMRDGLLRIPGAIGFLDAGTIALESLPLRSLELDDAIPDAAGLRAGDYPLFLRLALITRQGPSATVDPLLRALAELPSGDLEAAGYLLPAGVGDPQ